MTKTNRVLLSVQMQENDAGVDTVGEYLRALLRTLWVEGEGFSGKRPFGNSGWEYELYTALGKAKVIKAEFDEEGYLLDVDAKAANQLIFELIDAVFEPKEQVEVNPFKELLKKHKLRVRFTKANGDKREMLCTLREDYLPKQTDLEEQIERKAPNPEICKVWDIENDGWRSFRYDSMIDMYVEK